MTSGKTFDEAQRAEDVARALRESQRALARAKAKTEDLVAAVYEAAKSAALAYPPAPAIPAPRKAKPGDHWALLHSTDWQLGKRTATYDSDVAERRVVASIERALWLTDLQRKAHDVSSCALLLGGDMVEGTTIFAGQAHEIDATLFEQLFRVSALIERSTRTLMTHFDRVEVWEEYGNHGRIGKPGETVAADNIDRMAYKIAQDRLGTHKRLTWHPSTSWYNHGALGNYRFLLVHGDENRRLGAGTAASIVRQVQAYATGVVESFADCYMGHWHRHEALSLPNGGAVYLTGSPESGNEYARQHLGATGIPSQRLNFIDAERGRVVAEMKLWLDAA